MNVSDKFLTAIRTQSNTHKVLWIDWLADFPDAVIEDSFCDTYQCPYSNLSAAKIKEVWEFGVGFIKEEVTRERQVYSPVVTKVVEYLNSRAGTTYESKGKTTKKLIIQRIKDGYGIDDFITVIDNKCAEWLGTDNEKFLRPLTLFSTKFENYLNQKQNINERKQSTPISNTKSAIDKAKKFDFGLGNKQG